MPGRGREAMPRDVLTQGIVATQMPSSFGVVTLLTGLLVLACWIPLRQRLGVGTVANVIVISALVDPFLALLDGLPDPLGVRIARRPPASCSTAWRPACTSVPASGRDGVTGS